MLPATMAALKLPGGDANRKGSASEVPRPARARRATSGGRETSTAHQCHTPGRKPRHPKSPPGTAHHPPDTQRAETVHGRGPRPSHSASAPGEGPAGRGNDGDSTRARRLPCGGGAAGVLGGCPTRGGMAVMAGVLVVWLTLVGSVRAADAPRRPNVVFVLADQWRACATGYAGDPNVKTPNLDRLEKESVDFTHAVSACPVCTPCRASLMTGQRATTNGIFLNDAHLPDDATTLSKVLAAAGYDTGIIGKWHLSGGGRFSFIPREQRQGFEYWKAMECMHSYNHSFYYGDTPEKLAWDGYDAIAQTKDAQGYIKDHAKSDKPFFLCLWWGPPHNPPEAAAEAIQGFVRPGEDYPARPNVPRASCGCSAAKISSAITGIARRLDQCMGDLWKVHRGCGDRREYDFDFQRRSWGHAVFQRVQPETKAVG